MSLTDVVWYRYMDSDKRFQHVLEACGVNKTLKNMGVKEGDNVIIGEVCMSYFESFVCFKRFRFADCKS